MKSPIDRALTEMQGALNTIIESDEIKTNVLEAAELVTNSIRKGKNIFTCGNGGSMADAIHFAEEMTGRFRKDRPALPGIAISDAGHLTCTGNDFGYTKIFSRFIEGNAKKGDIVICISTSGESINVINAAISALGMGAHVISLTGKNAGQLAYHSDICIETPYGNNADRVQELHIKVIHIIIELVERNLFPNNYVE